MARKELRKADRLCVHKIGQLEFPTTVGTDKSVVSIREFVKRVLKGGAQISRAKGLLNAPAKIREIRQISTNLLLDLRTNCGLSSPLVGEEMAKLSRLQKKTVDAVGWLGSSGYQTVVYFRGSKNGMGFAKGILIGSKASSASKTTRPTRVKD